MIGQLAWLCATVRLSEYGLFAMVRLTNENWFAVELHTCCSEATDNVPLQELPL